MEEQHSTTNGAPEEAPVIHHPVAPAGVSNRAVPIALGSAVLAVLALGGFLIWRSESRTNKIALTGSAKPVTVVEARAKSFRPSRAYVGTLEPWLSASVGPQLVSAYVDTVLVRPGAIVKRGDVLATLDCRDASAASQAVAMEARAISARQKALSSEASRVQVLLAGKFVSPNEAEQKVAQSAAEAAHLEATKAKLAHQSLEVSDCILRAPFDGEVATRNIDPGAFVRPGMAIVSIVDRSIVRLSVDVPEGDFDVVAPETPVGIVVTATRKETRGTISRRAPSADAATRTVHFEVDLPDPGRKIPVGTTGVALIDVGEPLPSTEVPLYAATVRGKKAVVFVVEGDVAHARTVPVRGESGGSLFLDPQLAPGTRVVTEGRALLIEGDRVSIKLAQDGPPKEAGAAAPPAKERAQ